MNDFKLTNSPALDDLSLNAVHPRILDTIKKDRHLNTAELPTIGDALRVESILDKSDSWH